MWSLGVVEGQIFTEGGPGFWNIDISVQIDFLVFDRSPQPFNKDIVPPRSLAVHTDGDLGILQNLREGLAGKLRSLIGVEDVRLTVTGKRLFNRFNAKVCFQCDGEPPGQDTPAEPV